jgi:hypothetical protein
MSTQKLIESLILDKFKSLPVNYITTSGNLISDIGLNTNDNKFDDTVFSVLSKIHRQNLLQSQNKKLVVLGCSPKYSRNGKRPANLYKIVENNS